MIHAANKKERTPMINRQIGLIYLASTDPDVLTRTWNDVMVSYCESRKLDGASLDRLQRAGRAKEVAPLLNKKIIDTKPEEFLQYLNLGGVSVNVYLAVGTTMPSKWTTVRPSRKDVAKPQRLEANWLRSFAQKPSIRS